MPNVSLHLPYGDVRVVFETHGLKVYTSVATGDVIESVTVHAALLLVAPLYEDADCVFVFWRREIGDLLRVPRALFDVFEHVYTDRYFYPTREAALAAQTEET